MNLEEKIREVLFELAVQGNLVDHPSASAEFNWKITDPMSKATHALISLIREAKIEELEMLAEILPTEVHALVEGMPVFDTGTVYQKTLNNRLAELKAEAEL